MHIRVRFHSARFGTISSADRDAYRSRMTMRAMRIHRVGGAEAITEDRIARPTPAAGEALVRIEYAGVNFIDVYKRTGLYKMPLPATLGEEGAGVVESVGPGVTEVSAGA